MATARKVKEKNSVAGRGTEVGRLALPGPVFHDAAHGLKLYLGDCLDILAAIPPESIDMVFADPPYFLSNGGVTCHAGRMVSVNKGAWDRSHGANQNHEFNQLWLAACKRVLKPNGTLWVSGTSHVIHSIGFALQQLEFKLLNDVTWVKPNPPPNLSCRYFTHATETLIWAAKSKKSKHTFNYKLMKEINGGKQMKSVWEIKPPAKAEKAFGKHPTQKPVALLERIIEASTQKGDLVLDPFMGSGTTAVAALRLRRKAVAIDLEAAFLSLTVKRVMGELCLVRMEVNYFQVPLDLFPCFMDRSGERKHGTGIPKLATLVHQEQRFFFVGDDPREVVFSVTAESMDEAWKRFRKSPRAKLPIFSVIKTQTEIYLAQQL